MPVKKLGKGTRRLRKEKWSSYLFFTGNVAFLELSFYHGDMSKRPVECGQCKKGAKVLYKEIVDGKMTIIEMCVDCPILLKKLHGEPSEMPQGGEGVGLCCGQCHTSLEAVKMGNPMGCPDCYSAFGDLLIGELIEENRIPKHLASVRRDQPLHIGKTTEGPLEAPSSGRLSSLNEALNKALQQEKYEEAAWIRDQIAELMGKGNE